jgi:Uma2 family endonuclease
MAEDLRYSLLPAPDVQRVHRFDRDEYHEIYTAGILKGRRVELIDGQIVESARMTPLRACVVSLLHEKFARDHWREDSFVQVRGPLVHDEYNETEPDCVIVRGNLQKFERHPHACDALLVVEVADLHLLPERRERAKLYGAMNIQEFWLINLSTFQVEVSELPSAARREYGSVTVYGKGDLVKPRFDSSIEIAVSDLFPSQFS